MWLDPPFRTLARNAGWLLASDGTVLAAELAGTILIARALGVANYGRLSLVWAVVGVVNLVADVRAWEAVTRYLSEFTARRQAGAALATLKLAVLVDAVVAALGVGLAWVASGPVASRLLGDASLQPLIVLGALTLVGSAFDRTARAVLRVFDRFRALAACATLDAGGRLALVVGALGMNAGVRGVLLAYVVADFGAAMVLLAVAGREVRFRLWAARAAAPIVATRPYWREMLVFVGHSSVRATLKLATRRLDVLLLGHYRSPAEVGLYGAALRLAHVLEDLTDPLYFAAFPQFARTWVAARPEFFALLRGMALGLGLFTTASVGLGVLAAPLLFEVTLGPAYATAVDPFRLLLVETGLAVGTLWATPAVLGSGQPAVATKAATAAAVALTLTLVTLVPTWGATGAAWARVAGGLGSLVVIALWLRRILRQPSPSSAREPAANSR